MTHENKDWLSKGMFSILGGATGVILTYFTAVAGQGADIVRLTQQVIALGDRMADQTDRITTISNQINAGMDDRYRARDAVEDFMQRDRLIHENTEGIRALQQLHIKAGQ